MVGINLGSFTKIGDKTVSNGILSGLDTQSLINGLVKARQVPVTNLTDKVTLTDDKLTAYSELQNLLKNLSNASKALQNPPGFGNDQENAFNYRDVFLTSNDGSTANSFVGVSAEPGAQAGKYSLQVGQLAQAQSDRSLTFAKQDQNLGLGDGSFDIIVAGKHTTIALQQGDTLIDVASRINQNKNETGVAATIVKVSDNDFRLVLDSKNTGADNAFSYDFTATPSLESAFTFTTNKTAKDAIIDLNGLTIHRSSNNINDVIKGVTFSLYQTTSNFQQVNASVLNVEVDNGVTTAHDSITTFVNAYNDFRFFVGRQQERDKDGNFVKTAVLHQDSTLQSIANQVTSGVNGLIKGLSSGKANSLADIGITFTDFAGDDTNPPVANILLVDDTKLTNLLTSNFDDVKNLFEFNLTTSSNKLSVYQRGNNLPITGFSVDIDQTRASGDKARVTYTDDTGSHTVNMDYVATKDKSISKDITTTSILGAATVTDTFAATDGDRFKITVTDENGTATEYTLTYDSSNTGLSRFKNLTDLTAAINNTVTGVSASISGGQLVITPDDGGKTISFSNGDTTDFRGALGLNDTSVIGGSLKGQSGTIFDGYTFIYTGDGSDSIDATLSQGVADRLFNNLNPILSSTGTLQNTVDSLTERKSNTQEDITRLNSQIDRYRNALLNQYSRLEQAVASANSILQLLDSQQQAQSSD
ncbi:MAG: flagellar filament capping protein FliD [Alphaproteobacteria bacterium]|nr:flagellar filament capping protein FliD [Alphaproteobacteria bacterium]